MINYETIIRKNDSHRLNRSKRNLLIIGDAGTNAKQKIILNPISTTNARKIYGNGSLYEAYKLARDITNDDNIYTVNCPLYTDFIEIIDSLVHYNFDFIVPINIYLRDTFINPVTNKITYFSTYYLERLGITENQTTLFMTDRPSDLYDDIDVYLDDMKSIYDTYVNKNIDIINKFGNNIAFILNNLKRNPYSNVLMAASLSVCGFSTYPADIPVATHFDIDYIDLGNYNSICFYKYHHAANISSLEQLVNMRVANDIYKKILIDILVKYVVKKLDLSEFNGVLYNPYVKVRIDTKVTKIMNELKKEAFKDYKIKSITFKKTGIGVGNIIIDVSITPYSLLENINVILEV